LERHGTRIEDVDDAAIAAFALGATLVTANLDHAMARYDDLEAICFFARPLRAAQYLRMRSDIARRLAGIRRCFPSRRLGVGSLSFAGLLIFVCLDDAFELAAVDGFVATVLTAAHFGGIAGAISMPNISERSSLASTFTPAGLCFFARSEPASRSSPANRRCGA
jgi:hypothetical protein